jgi:phage terminase large subunit
MNAKLQTNKVYELLASSDKRITVMQGGSRCFTGETLVLTHDGYKKIRDIEIGEMVFSLNTLGKPVLFPVINKFMYTGDQHKHKVITFVLSDGQKITCTYGHKLLQNDGYVESFDIAVRMLAADTWHRKSLFSEQYGEDSRNEVQNEEGFGWNEDNETSFGRKWLPKNNVKDGQQVQNSQGSPDSSGSVHRQSVRETSGEPYRQQSSEQQSFEFGMGDIQGKYSPHDESREADVQQWGKEWKKYPYRRYCKANKVGVQALRSDDERFSAKVWSEDMHYQRYFNGAVLGEHCLSIDEVDEIIFHETQDTVYDLMIAPFHNYLVTTRNIISHNSGKTYNILIWFIVKLLQENGKTLTIVRQSLPSIKGTVLRDFIDILVKLNIYSENNHNKTDQIYSLNGNIIEFVSADQPQKIRGRARNYLFCNEANELSYEAWMQLIMRTEGKIVIDYNPSDVSSWIYDNVIPRDDSDFHITTFMDNPFLPKELVDELNRLKDADPNYWQIYGLGERGLSQDLIYTHYRTTENMPEEGQGETVYGLDFGFNVPSALVKVVFYDGVAYAQELLYETRLTTNDLVDRVKALGLSPMDEIYCDAAEPKTIEELVRNGFNAKPANKDVTEGIRCVKGTPLTIHQESLNLLKELKNYRWKTDRNGNKLDQPVKFADHISDSLRYAIYSKLTIPSVTWGVI